MTRTALLLVLASCGPMPGADAGIDAGRPDAGDVKACSTSCAGCCDGRTGRCAGGVDLPFSDAACPPTDTAGLAVVYCTTCDTSAGELCGRVVNSARDSQCVKRSSRCLTCTGCCDESSGVCSRGTDDARCGSGGAACRDCGAGMTCRLNSCSVP